MITGDYCCFDNFCSLLLDNSLVLIWKLAFLSLIVYYLVVFYVLVLMSLIDYYCLLCYYLARLVYYFAFIPSCYLVYLLNLDTLGLILTPTILEFLSVINKLFVNCYDDY